MFGTTFRAMSILLGLAIYMAVSIVASVLIGAMLKAGSLVPAVRGGTPARAAKAAIRAAEAT